MSLPGADIQAREARAVIIRASMRGIHPTGNGSVTVVLTRAYRASEKCRVRDLGTPWAAARLTIRESSYQTIHMPQRFAAPASLLSGAAQGEYVEPHRGSTLLLRSAHGRRAFWAERLQAARAAQDRDAEATAERFLREYEQFITLLTEQAGAV